MGCDADGVVGGRMGGEGDARGVVRAMEMDAAECPLAAASSFADLNFWHLALAMCGTEHKCNVLI